MKNITFFVGLSLESPNGVGRYFPIAKELVKRNCKVNIIALHHNFKSLKKKSFVKEGVKVYYVGQMHVLKINDTKVYLSKFQLIKTVFLSTLKMCLKGLSLRSDAIYLFKPQPINGVAALVVKLFKRVRLFVDCDDYEALSNRLSKLEKVIFVLFEDNLPKLADKVTTHNSFLKERYQNLGVNEKDLVYLPNGIDVERFENIDENKIVDLKNKFDLRNKKVVLYFGSLGLKSGHTIDLLLKAFVLVKRKVKNSVLILVGGGEDIELLKNYAKNLGINAIIFTGRVDGDDIPNYIKLADVTVDPIDDSFANKARSPLKIVESMALGVPVVTGDVGDRKIMTKNKTAILVKPGDEKELANGIIKVLSDDKLAKRMSEDSLRLIKNYHWDKLTNIVHNFLDSNNSPE